MNLERVYGRAERELKAMLSAIDPLNFDAEKAEKIRRTAQSLAQGLNLAAKEWTETDIPGAYTLGARRARVALEILGRKPRRQLVSKLAIIHMDALETLVKANLSIPRTVDEILQAALVGAQTARSAQVQEFDRRKTLQKFEELGEEAVAAEISRGELGRQIIDFLKRQIDEDGLILVKGKYWDARKYAKLVARTEIRKAQTEATKDSCRQYDNDLVWVAPHGTICDICMPLEDGDGVFSLSGKDPIYPPLPVEIPAHPNCQHSMSPTSHTAIGIASRRK